MPPQTEHKLFFIHRFIRGAGANESTTLLLLHGTGGDENDLIDLGCRLLPGATLLSPRGKVLENEMPRFFRRLAEGVFDVDDLIQRTHELAGFIGEACTAYSLDARKIIAVGYSNGANIAASMLFLYPDMLASAVLFRPMVPFIPNSLSRLNGKRILILSGRDDVIAKADNAETLARLFSSAGADANIHWHNGGHELGEDDFNAAQSWLKKD